MTGPWVILPTYNEAECVESLLGAVAEQLGRAAPNGHRILVVDDDSPDGTGRLADRVAAEHRASRWSTAPASDGLGSAYRDGFRRALERRRRAGARDGLPTSRTTRRTSSA